MLERCWDDVYDKNAEIVRKILEYNSNITNGNYVEFRDGLDITVYHNLLAAHIVALLIDDDELFVSNNVISKLEISLKECNETEYWLELFVKSDILNREITLDLYNQCGTIRRILIASINTAKENKQ